MYTDLARIKGPRARVLWLRRPHRLPVSCCSRKRHTLQYVSTCRILRTLAAHVCTVRHREQPANRTVGGRLWVGLSAATIRIVQGDAESDGYPRARPRHDRQHPGGLGEGLYPFQYTVYILCGSLGMEHQLSCHARLVPPTRFPAVEHWSPTPGIGPRQGGQVAVLRAVRVEKKASNRTSSRVSHL